MVPQPRVDRARAERGRRPGPLPRALPARLPGRGPLPQAPLRRARTRERSSELAAEAEGITALVGFAEPVPATRRGAASDGPAAARSTTRSPCCATARSRPSTARTGCPTTASSTSVRYFEPGAAAEADRGRRRRRVGLTICEDLWEPGPPALARGRGGRPADRQRLRLPVPARQGRRARGDVRRARPRVRGSDRVLQPGRRPGRARLRRPQLRRRRRRRVVARARQFEEDLLLWRARRRAGAGRGAARSDLAEVYAALVLGLRDYVAQERLRARSSLGLSGGIDSALVALIAADALGAERLTCVVMPSPYSSDETQADARAIAAQPRRRADRAPDRAGDARLRRSARRELERRAGSPPRTSRRGSAATC